MRRLLLASLTAAALMAAARPSSTAMSCTAPMTSGGNAETDSTRRSTIPTARPRIVGYW